MRIAIDLDDRTIRTWAGQALSELTAKRRDRFPVEVRFLRGGIGQELANGATATIGIKSSGAYASEFLASSSDWTKSGKGSGSTYRFDLTLNTVEMDSAFSSAPDSISASLEVEYVQGTYRESSMPINLVVGNDYVRGDEATPTPANTLIPVVQFIDDVPSSKTDFFMFPGGTPPASGLYQAADGHYNYTIKGGWTMWRRSPIASW